ncbi:unnamed protein product [Cladocopium goreaui]|uniref:Uncharacterized protein n=1 Tax=Cladocopium goreaui TaxID=2562237 RepID=A0A9P1D5B2_9DINO|nr:unnamed protein product [Cladocopium goreaui]
MKSAIYCFSWQGDRYRVGTGDVLGCCAKDGLRAIILRPHGFLGAAMVAIVRFVQSHAAALWPETIVRSMAEADDFLLAQQRSRLSHSARDISNSAELVLETPSNVAKPEPVLAEAAKARRGRSKTQEDGFHVDLWVPTERETIQDVAELEIPPPSRMRSLLSLRRWPDVTPEDLPTLGPAPTRAPPLYPCNLEQAKIAPWLLRLPCNLTAAPESLMTPPAVVSPEKIPEDRSFPFPMQPQMPSMPGAGNLAKLGNNLPGANMMNAGLPTAPTVPSMPRVPTMPGVPTMPTAPSMPAMPGAFLEKSAKVEKRSLRAGNQAIREAGDAEMTCDCED